MHGAPEWETAIPESDAMDLDEAVVDAPGGRPGLKRALEGWEEAQAAAKRRRSLDTTQVSDAVGQSHASEWPSATVFPGASKLGDSDSEGEIAESHLQPMQSQERWPGCARLQQGPQAGKENAPSAGRQSFPSAHRLLGPQGSQAAPGATPVPGRKLRSDTPARSALRGSGSGVPAPNRARTAQRSMWPADLNPSLRASLCSAAQPRAQASSLPGWDLLEAAEWLGSHTQPPLPGDLQPEE